MFTIVREGALTNPMPLAESAHIIFVSRRKNTAFIPNICTLPAFF